MARKLVCAVAVVCAACTNPGEEPASVEGEHNARIARLLVKADEGQMRKKDAPKRAAQAAPMGSVLKEEAAPAQGPHQADGRSGPAAAAFKGQAGGGLERARVMGKVFGSAGGDAQGMAGLGLRGSGSGSGAGLSGTGQGGGGVGQAIGVGHVGTSGRGGGTAAYGSASGYGGLGLSGTGAGHGTIVLRQAVVAGKVGGRQAGDPVAESANGVGTFENPGVNPFVAAAEDRLSTFAADVDTASYTLARRVILEGRLPPEDSVRVEEFVNYFKYRYPEPKDAPLGVSMELAPSPYTAGRHLLKVGVQGKRLAMHERKAAHLTFLVDVSGSMQSPDKLPLAKRTLRMLVDQLRDGDTVALVTYAGGVKLALPHTGLEHKARIHAAIEELTAGGGTGMASGIELAYQQAEKALDDQSFSRVIILSDGDANIGPAQPKQLLELIKGKVKEGVTVTTAGFGTGNYRDELMEQFANAGNGNHHYIDSAWQARRVFVEQLGSTLEVIAQDVKLQVDFDPEKVKRYRLVGYENRNVADRDFRNDKVDGGEVGSGHSVTAVYELELGGAPQAGLATVRVRAKKPRGVEATEWATRLGEGDLRPELRAASADFRFAAAVVGAAELFRRSPHAKAWKLSDVLAIAKGAAEGSPERQEFVALLEQAQARAVLAAR